MDHRGVRRRRYIAVWGLAIAVASLGVVTTPADADEWEDLTRAVLGFLAGVALGHLIWWTVVAWVLAPYGRPGRTVAVAVGLPAAVVAVAVVLAPLGPLMVLAAAIPWVFAMWATDPGDGRREVRFPPETVPPDA
jgi:hypothetical protein